MSCSHADHMALLFSMTPEAMQIGQREIGHFFSDF